MNSININDMATSEYKKYSYASEQDYITVTNTGTSDLMFDVGKYTNIVLHPSQTWANEVGFKEFQIKSLGSPCIFTAELREYGNDYVTSAQLAEMSNYVTVAAVANVYTIDLASRPIKNIRMTTADAVAKTVALANVPAGDCELFIELTYTNAAAITWFANIVWLSGSAPTFIAGKVYRLAFFKVGNNWHGNCVGGW